MSEEYKKCPKGHYYQGDTCPYCKTTSNAGGPSQRTDIFGGGMGNGAGSTQPYNGGGYGEMTKTQPYGEPGMGGVSNNKTTVIDDGSYTPAGPSAPNRTMFGDETIEEPVRNANAPQQPGQASPYRATRKLVGWLVSYTLDAMGQDFKLYEGRNIIGRDMDCSITVNDKMVSAKHAVLLFRAGKYSLTDQQSSHGTFVNGQDIELEPRYLQDGDEIRMGETIFKFRTSF